MAAMLCAAILLAGCSSDGSGPAPSPAPSTAEKPQVVRPAVVLDGSYVFAFDGTGTKNGAPANDLNRTENAWVFRTACDENRCVATGGSVADPKNPTAPLKNVRVADYVDGRWLMVNYIQDSAKCEATDGTKYSSGAWAIWDFAIADKALTATVTTVGTDDCPFIHVQSPTITRLNDPLPGFPLPPPADQPPRSVPAAAAFHGDYTVTRSPRDKPDAKAISSHEVETSCLRTEDRCVTTSIRRDIGGADGAFTEFTVYQFGDGAFRRTSAAAPRGCGDGTEGIATAAESLPLTEVGASSSSSLRTLTGQNDVTFTSGCPGERVDDVQYELAGG